MRLRSSTRKSNSATNSPSQLKSLDEDSTMIMERSSGSTTTSPYQRPIRGLELKKLVNIAVLASVAAGVLMLSTFVMVHSDKIGLYPSNISAELLKDYAAKAEFTLKYQVLLILWLIINIHIVIFNRLTKGALNPLTECTEHAAQASKFILTNSCEQILVSLFTQMIFIAFADGSCVLRVIPWFNMIQFLGRITFFAGYPLYRTFGMMLTLVPNTLLTLYNVYKFGNFINLY